MHPQKQFHLVFSLLMGAIMIFLMTFVITLVNVGLSPHFVASWMKAFGVAYVVGVPVIFFVAPMARKLTARLVGPAPWRHGPPPDASLAGDLRLHDRSRAARAAPFVNQELSMDIKVLGTGCCGNCQTTFALIEQVAQAKGVAVNLRKVEGMRDIVSYGVMRTPGVVIDGKVVHAGGVPSREKVEQWLSA